MRRHLRAVDAFDDWFSSDWGAIQVFYLTIVLMAMEVARPSIDKHWFWLLVGMTVFSCVTQNILARGNRKAMERIEALEQRILSHLEGDRGE